MSRQSLQDKVGMNFHEHCRIKKCCFTLQVTWAACLATV